MWDILQQIQFLEISGARLFGEKLIEELEKGSYDISGEKSGRGGGRNTSQP